MIGLCLCRWKGYITLHIIKVAKGNLIWISTFTLQMATFLLENITYLTELRLYKDAPSCINTHLKEYNQGTLSQTYFIPRIINSSRLASYFLLFFTSFTFPLCVEHKAGLTRLPSAVFYKNTKYLKLNCRLQKYRIRIQKLLKEVK